MKQTLERTERRKSTVGQVEEPPPTRRQWYKGSRHGRLRQLLLGLAEMHVEELSTLARDSSPAMANAVSNDTSLIAAEIHEVIEHFACGQEEDSFAEPTSHI
uniref:Uncharacterized protein n=1 Tax=Octactis speculum TaxID=3111310 RepID=A0A7S2DAA9_9STRA|mmetsp:Transcript_44943/g.61407  ORF Transcript_44943/g.61407 Transcript_44943/m.61407 type:complete len:102 (+) Transcript_44943:104-409(+)